MAAFPGIVRPAHVADVDALIGLIHELAIYEKFPDAVVNTEERLKAALFGPDPRVFAHVAELDGTVIGMAIWFLDYSTWTGTHGIYLEDLFVQPAGRGTGAGHALLAALAAIAVARGYARMSWSVLEWNELALDFYRAHRAEALDGWIGYRLSGEALTALGAPQD